MEGIKSDKVMEIKNGRESHTDVIDVDKSNHLLLNQVKQAQTEMQYRGVVILLKILNMI